MKVLQPRCRSMKVEHNHNLLQYLEALIEYYIMGACLAALVRFLGVVVDKSSYC